MNHTVVFLKSVKVHKLYFEISTFRQIIICSQTMVSIKEIGQFVSNDNTYISKLFGFFFIIGVIKQLLLLKALLRN